MQKTIGTAGGTVAATDAKGTTYSLVVAPNSVPDATRITLTPVTAFDAGLGGSFGAGVEMGPEGLLLMHGGLLTITPLRPLGVAQQQLLGFAAEGKGVSVLPPAPALDRIDIPIVHFSGVVVAPGSSDPAASTNADFYAILLRDLVQSYRDSGKDLDNDFSTQAQSILDDFYHAILRDEVPSGLTDDDAATLAIRDLLAYARWSALYLGVDRLSDVVPTIQKLFDGMYDRAQQRCAANHDLSQIRNILAIDRSEILLGRQEGDLSDDFACLRFRIAFDSGITFHCGDGAAGPWDLEYVAQVPVTIDNASGDTYLSGQAGGRYAKASGTCTAGDGTGTIKSAHGATFEVLKFVISVDPSSGDAPYLIFQPNKPSEVVHACSGGCGDIAFDYWLTAFDRDHRIDAAAPVDLSLQRVANDGALVARGTWSLSASGNGGWDEATTIDVFHTPPTPPRR